MFKKINVQQVIVVDARNHGDSPHSSNMSYKDMAEDVIQLLNDLGFERAVLVGHSMGGSAMMYTALNFPQHVEKLAVVDISPVRTSPSLLQIKKIFDAMGLAMANGSPTLSKARKIVDQQLEKSIKSSALRQVIFLPVSRFTLGMRKLYLYYISLQFLISNLVEVDSGKYKWRMNLPVLEQAFSTQIAVFPKVDSKVYANPTLFIGGANSDYIRVEDHDAIKKLFPLAEFHYIDGADHWVHADKPIEFVDLLTNFINHSVL